MKTKHHYVVRVVAPVGPSRDLAVFDDYDSAYNFARDIDWAQIVIFISGE